jgi:FMN phosphatase YigB (HAD superfamily)
MEEMTKDEETIQRNKPDVIIMDLGKVLLYSTEEGHKGKLNPRHKQLMEELGDDYDFFNYFGLNEDLLSLLSELKEEYPIHMITEGTIQNFPPLKEKLETAFDYSNIHSTGNLGLDKKTPEAYSKILGELGLNPKDVLFVDDGEENISAASKAGLQTTRFASEEQVIQDLKNKLSWKDTS